MELLIGKRQKFNVVCDEWLEYKKMRIKESTYANYKLKITNYLKKDFGERNLKEIANINLNRYVEELQFKLSSKTVKDIITVLKSILKYAERKYNMDFKLDLVSTPLTTTKEAEVFNERERKKIEEYILDSDNIMNLGILISMYTGLRIGEVCALKWSDIDFESKKIRIRHTVQRIYMSKKIQNL